MKTQNTKELTANNAYNEQGYLQPDAIESVILTAYSRPMTYGGRKFFQKIELKNGEIVEHKGNTASTKGTFGGGRVIENVLQRDLKDFYTTKTIVY